MITYTIKKLKLNFRNVNSSVLINSIRSALIFRYIKSMCQVSLRRKITLPIQGIAMETVTLTHNS